MKCKCVSAVVVVFGRRVLGLCICVRAQMEKKGPGKPSIVAVSSALTEGNGPYSNPLKDEGYKRFRCTETSGRKRQKKRQGRDGEAPVLRLIESSFTTASTSLKNQGVFQSSNNKKKKEKEKRRGPACSYSITNTRRVYLFYGSHGAAERIRRRRRAAHS